MSNLLKKVEGKAEQHLEKK
jgi:hypothetical protein